MCINTKYGMSIIKKVFHYEENKISVIKCNDEIWFRGKSVAQSLGYLKPLKALHTHVDKDDKRKLSDLEGVPQNGIHLRPVFPKMWYTLTYSQGVYLLTNLVSILSY